MSGDRWVFGYGSLMWRPGFAFQEAVPARLTGFRRCFCIYSVVHRGTAERPGLVLGLDRGGTCDGLAFRVAERDVARTLAYLRAREQVNGVYRETGVPVTLGRAERTSATALAYLAERQHPSYTGALSLGVQARLIRAASGRSGANIDYLVNTLFHLRELGIRERELERLLTLVGAFVARGDTLEIRTARGLGLRRAGARHGVIAKRLRPDQRKRFVYRMSTKTG